MTSFSISRRAGVVGVALAVLFVFANAPHAAAADDYPSPDRNAVDCSAQFGRSSWCIDKNGDGSFTSDELASARGFYYRTCTDFVAFRKGLTWAQFKFSDGNGNAVNWRDHAANIGYSVTSTPSIGDIAWWGANHDASASGHVAVVTGVASDGSVSVEEYNALHPGAYDARDGQRADSYLHPGGAASTTTSTSTSTNPSTTTTTTPTPPPTPPQPVGPLPAANPGDVSFVKIRNTGTGRVEGFTVTAASGYQSGIAAPTRFMPGDAANGTFAMLANGDVSFVKLRNTGSGTVEAFTVTTASHYTSGIAAATRFNPGDAPNGQFGMLPNGDIYFVKINNTGSGRVEVHTATLASGYRAGVSAATRFLPGDAANGVFGVLPNGDVYFVKVRNTGTGHVEAFTVTPASNYQQGVAAPTRFFPFDADNGTFAMTATGDVSFVKIRNTGTGHVEAFTVTRASNYQQGLATGTRYYPADADNGTFALL